MDGHDPPTSTTTTPSPPHSDDSTVPSSSAQTIIHQHQPAPVASAAPAASSAKSAPTPSARQQVPAPNATELRAPPLPLGAHGDVTDFGPDQHSIQHLYNTPIYDGGNAVGDKKPPAGNGGGNPKDDVEIFSSLPIVVHVPKSKSKGAKDSASASSSITLLTGADADTGVVRTGGGSPLPAGAAGPGRRARRGGRCATVASVWLAVGQLLCSVALTAVGVLMWTRGATFAHGAAGLWAGAVCGVAGALGVINERKARTGYLAVSLICVASSTLAMALTGIGLVRDLNANTNRGAVTAASGLLAALAVHFLISVLAVYYSAMQQCSSRHRQDQLHHKHHPQQSLSSATLSAKHAHNNVGTASHSQLGENIVYATGGAFCGPTAGNGAAATATASNPAHLSRQRVEQYFRSLPRDGSANGGGGGGAPMHSQKMMQLAKTASKASSELYHDKPTMMPMPVWTSGAAGKPPQPPRPMMLVPAGLNANLLPVYHPIQAQAHAPPQLLYPPHLAPPGMLAYHHQHRHHPAPASALAYTHSLMRPHRHHHHHPPPPPHHHQHYSSTLDAALLHPSEQPHRMQRTKRNSASAAAARRRKSESDRNGGAGVSNPAFVYHGLDRAIADSFLEQQERQNASIECTSLSGRGADVAM